ncbi:MAG: sensor domain-containing diguanylate cyclase [Deltaproteobacteria bacterium]|nr:sensor domain-containing diguanylate cyclase [Deltaproteobacteria bacterium]
MEDLGNLVVGHLSELGLLAFVSLTFGYLLGRGSSSKQAGGRIRDLEKIAARSEMSSQEHQRSAQDLYERAERAEQTVRKLERSLIELPEVAQRLSSVHELQEIPHRALELVKELFDPTYAVFFKTRRGMLVAQSVLGASPYKLGQKIRPGEGIVGLAAVKQLPFTPVDLRFETAQVKHQMAASGVGETDFSLCLPVVAEHLTIGVIMVGPMLREIPNARDVGRTVALLTSVAMMSAAVLKQQKLLAKTDGLTGLLNRVHIVKRASEIIDAEGDTPRTLSVFIFDIDHFKHYNDTNGHLPGDDLLRHLAALLKETVREGESVGRYGGEEFLMVMPDTDREAAFQAAERIRQLIEKQDFAFGDKQPGGRITVSGGVATWPADAEAIEPLLKRADDALYKAKRAGRNRVFTYTPQALGSDDPYDPATGEFHSLLVEDGDE